MKTKVIFALIALVTLYSGTTKTSIAKRRSQSVSVKITDMMTGQLIVH